MPGRVSARNPPVSHPSHESSAPTLASRKSTTSRVSSPTAVISDEGPSSSLRTQLCTIFGDAQRTTAGHRKLAISLRKVQDACCYEPTNAKSKKGAEFGEDDFNVEIARCVLRLMGVKKGEGVGDRIVRFLGFFLKHASEKGLRCVPPVHGA
jgi:condensin complex subunit 3